MLALMMCLSAVANDPAFTARLHLDWKTQDAPHTTEWFTDSTGNANEVKMVQKVLAELTGIEESWKIRLTNLQSANVPGNDPRWRELYYDVCNERRKQRLQFVQQTYPVIVYTKHDIFGGSHYSYTENVSDAQYQDRVPQTGGALHSLEITPDGEIIDKLLIKAPENGILRDPDVSFDGKKILFSMRNSMAQDDYKLYDYCVETGAVRQLTFGLGFADIEPCYLPDGNILFASTRCMQIVDCWWTEVVNLYICDSDGRFMRRVGFDQVHTNYPKVLPDGRVTYTRWDYNDRGQIFPHGLFMMNHDGTGQTEYYGNNSWFPTSILHARGIPHSNKVIAIASGHHTLQKGKLVLINRSKGRQENQGAQLIAPVRETLVEKIDAWGQEGDQFQYPLALDEKNFIVTYQVPTLSGHFGLFYMDIDNSKRELLAWDPSSAASHCGQPVPLQAREVPILRASTVDHTKNTGVYYVQDVYFGPGLEGVERGTIKELRVVGLHFRAAGIDRNGNSGEAGAALVSTPISIDNGTWDVKQVLGTVPVHEDGSAFFEVPARLPIYFQLLNDRGETVQTMRSWSTLQPGEQQNCYGCHEDKGSSALSDGGVRRTQALRRAPRKPVPVEGVDPNSGFSFIQSIQPIFDKNCTTCHTGEAAGEEDVAPFSLLDKPVVLAGRSFSESYLNLTQRGKKNDFVYWLDVQSGPPMLPPNYAGAVKSKLISMFDEGNRSEAHQDVVLTDQECRLLALWIDLLVPFSGCYTERHHWTREQQMEYAYYQMKRDTMAEIEQKNVQLLIMWQRGEIELPTLDNFEEFTCGGVERKLEFMGTWHLDLEAQPADVSEVDLTWARWISARTGSDTPMRGRTPVFPHLKQDGVLRIGGRSFESGLFTHATSSYQFRLGGNWKTFKSGYGIQDGMIEHGASVVFVVLGDGKELFRSPVIKDNQLRRLEVDVSGIQILELIVEDGGDSIYADWGHWIEPTLERKGF